MPRRVGLLVPLGVTVTSIDARTSSGCLGGPRGCTDAVDVRVTLESQEEVVRLRAPRTASEREARVDQARVFERVLALKELRPDRVPLTLQPREEV
jgi:hypothetical protein